MLGIVELDCIASSQTTAGSFVARLRTQKLDVLLRNGQRSRRRRNLRKFFNNSNKTTWRIPGTLVADLPHSVMPTKLLRAMHWFTEDMSHSRAGL